MASEPIVFEDGRPYFMRPNDMLLRIACCDCGLVHDITLTIVGDNLISFKLERNEEETEKIRNEFGSDSPDN